MSIRTVVAAAAALGLAASPAIAQSERSSAPTGETDEFRGGSSLVLAILAIAAIIAGIIIAVDGDDDGPLSS